MNKFLKYIIPVSGFMALAGYSGCSEIKEGYSAPAANSFTVEVGNSTSATLYGVGVELDPHFFSQNVTRNDGATAADWDIVVKRVKQMKVERFRVMLQPQWWEPRNDNADPAVADMSKFTFESAEMNSVYKVLDLAQEIGAEVTLVLWGCPISCNLIDNAYADVQRHFLCGNGTNWVVAPADNAEWAENFSTCVKYLLETKNYTCIKEITPFNEPDGGIYATAAEYVTMVNVLEAKFTTDGIRSKVRFNLSDNTDTRRWFLQGCAEGLGNKADMYNSHTYIFGYATPNSTICEWERLNVEAVKATGRPHLVGEFGSNQCVGASRQTDINLYERGVLMTRLVLNFLNSGASGVSYWSLIDQYYGRNETYNSMQQLGLWHYVKEAYANDAAEYAACTSNYSVRPQYYAYSLLTRFIRKGATVYPMDFKDDFIAGSAFMTDGKWTYIIANNTDHNKPVILKNAKGTANAQYDYYLYAETKLPQGDSLIAPSQKLNSSSNQLSVSVPRHSVVVLVEP